MSNSSNALQALLDRLFGKESGRQRATEITQLSIHSIRKACYDKAPKGWVALLIETDRQHLERIKVLEAKITVLEARIKELER